MNATEEQKKVLRKIKEIEHKAVEVSRNTLVCGCTEQMAYVQFGIDVQTYNLWEALLYAEGYEGKGYKPGTAQKALDAAWRKISSVPR